MAEESSDNYILKYSIPDEVDWAKKDTYIRFLDSREREHVNSDAAKVAYIVFANDYFDNRLKKFELIYLSITTDWFNYNRSDDIVLIKEAFLYSLLLVPKQFNELMDIANISAILSNIHLNRNISIGTMLDNKDINGWNISTIATDETLVSATSLIRSDDTGLIINMPNYMYSSINHIFSYFAQHLLSSNNPTGNVDTNLSKKLVKFIHLKDRITTLLRSL